MEVGVFCKYNLEFVRVLITLFKAWIFVMVCLGFTFNSFFLLCHLTPPHPLRFQYLFVSCVFSIYLVYLMYYVISYLLFIL
jgi:hypothetical protein